MGPLMPACARTEFSLPYPSFTRPSNSSPGSLVRMMMAPPMALRPYTAPCGPFSTSICSMSNSSWLNSAGLVSSTPSTSTATEGSLLRACEMPRTTTKALPAFCVSTSVMLGTRAMKSAGLSMPAASMVSAVNTLTVIGTSLETFRCAGGR